MCSGVVGDTAVGVRSRVLPSTHFQFLKNDTQQITAKSLIRCTMGTKMLLNVKRQQFMNCTNSLS